jgi:hypothetical protein
MEKLRGVYGKNRKENLPTHLRARSISSEPYTGIRYDLCKLASEKIRMPYFFRITDPAF